MNFCSDNNCTVSVDNFVNDGSDLQYLRNHNGYLKCILLIKIHHTYGGLNKNLMCFDDISGYFVFVHL